MIAKHPVSQKALSLSLWLDSSMSPPLYRWFSLFSSIIPRNLSVKPPRLVKCYFMLIVRGNCRATRFRSSCNCCRQVISRLCRSSTCRKHIFYRKFCSNDISCNILVRGSWYFYEKNWRSGILSNLLSPKYYSLNIIFIIEINQAAKATHFLKDYLIII